MALIDKFDDYHPQSMQFGIAHLSAGQALRAPWRNAKIRDASSWPNQMDQSLWVHSHYQFGVSFAGGLSLVTDTVGSSAQSYVIEWSELRDIAVEDSRDEDRQPEV